MESKFRRTVEYIKKRKWLRIIVTILLFYIAYDIVQAASIRARIAIQLKAFPDLRYRHYGMCGTPILGMKAHFQLGILGATPEVMIPLLHRSPPYLREVVHDNLRLLGPVARPAIWTHYAIGDARTRLELYDYVFPNGPIEGKFHLLNKIIHNRRLDVFSGDERLVRESWIGTATTPPVDGYSVDIVTFYKRLMLESDDATARAGAIGRLSTFDLDPEEFVPLLRGILDERNEYVNSMFYQSGPQSRSLHSAAMIALSEFGPDASDAIPRLNEIFNEDDPYLKPQAAACLYLIEYEQNEMLSYLQNELESYQVDNHDESLYRQHDECAEIVGCLGWIGPDAIDSLPLLIEFAKFGNVYIRGNARWAVSRVEESDETVVRILAVQLQSDDQSLREEAANAIWFMRDSDISIAIPVILERIQVAEGSEAERLCQTLVNSEGTHKEEVVAAIISAIERQSEGYDRMATLLREIGPEASAAIPALKLMIESEDAQTVSTGAFVYIDIGGDPQYLVRELIDNLDHPNYNMVNVSIWKLEAIGPDAYEALPSLEQLARTADERTQSFANEAIAAIRGE